MIAELEREETKLEQEVSGLSVAGRVRYGHLSRRMNMPGFTDAACDSLIRRFRVATERVRRSRKHVTKLKAQVRGHLGNEQFSSQAIARIERLQESFRDMRGQFHSITSRPPVTRLMQYRRVAINYEILMLELEIVYSELESLRWHMEEHNVDVGPVNRDSVPVTTGEQIDAIFDQL